MNLWTSLKKNNYFKFIIFITFLSVVTGFLFYNKIGAEINNLSINFETLIKNHSIYHILFVAFIFFFTFLILGTFIGIIIYMFEVTSLSILCILICKEFHFKGFLVSVSVIIFKLLVLVLFLYLISRCYKITRQILKRSNSNETLIFYFKEAVFTSLVIISIELFNYFFGYHIITFFAKLLEIMV